MRTSTSSGLATSADNTQKTTRTHNTQTRKKTDKHTWAAMIVYFTQTTRHDCFLLVSNN